jgi:UDP-N-acetylmuramyl pentapeptide phosphotransferase/UDP-N-acetylglucosamine-1-phosphate transferase
VLIAATVLLGVVSGWLRGGSLRHLTSWSIRAGGLAVAAAVAQAVHAFVPAPAVAVTTTVLSQCALLGFLWFNRYVAGAFLVAVGSTLNAAVILANGAMPVSREAIMAVARHPYEVVGRHRLLETGDPLPWLADIIGLPVLRTVVSIGDVVLAAGIGVLVSALMQTPPRRVQV